VRCTLADGRPVVGLRVDRAEDMSRFLAAVNGFADAQSELSGGGGGGGGGGGPSAAAAPLGLHPGLPAIGPPPGLPAIGLHPGLPAIGLHPGLPAIGVKVEPKRER